jgi:hypothetical protein
MFLYIWLARKTCSNPHHCLYVMSHRMDPQYISMLLLPSTTSVSGNRLKMSRMTVTLPTMTLQSWSPGRVFTYPSTLSYYPNTHSTAFIQMMNNSMCCLCLCLLTGKTSAERKTSVTHWVNKRLHIQIQLCPCHLQWLRVNVPPLFQCFS